LNVAVRHAAGAEAGVQKRLVRRSGAQSARDRAAHSRRRSLPPGEENSDESVFLMAAIFGDFAM
jgi:hypothetical protein